MILKYVPDCSEPQGSHCFPMNPVHILISQRVTKPKWWSWYLCMRFLHCNRGVGGGIPAEDVCYLLFGWTLRSPLFHNIRGFGDALGLQSRDTSFPSVAITQTGLSTKTGAEAKKGHSKFIFILKYSSKSTLHSECHWRQWQYYHTLPEPAVKTSYNRKESTTDDWSP